AAGRAPGEGRPRRGAGQVAVRQRLSIASPRETIMNTRTVLAFASFLAAAVTLSGCADPRSHTNAVYMLVDTSGTYAREANKAQIIVNYLLGTLQPGDSLAIARVESRSFSEKDIIAKARFDTRPSQANVQKRAFKDKMDGYFRGIKGAAYTDITGG